MARSPHKCAKCGRPIKQGREAVINIRASAKDLALIDQAAEVLGITRSQFLRECAAKQANAVMTRVSALERELR